MINLALTHPKATKGYMGESRKCTKSDYVKEGGLMGTKSLPGQRHPSGVLKVDSVCGARGPLFESKGGTPLF